MCLLSDFTMCNILYMRTYSYINLQTAIYRMKIIIYNRRYNTLFMSLYYNRQFLAFVDYLKKGVDKVRPWWYYVIVKGNETQTTTNKHGAPICGGLHYV